MKKFYEWSVNPADFSKDSEEGFECAKDFHDGVLNEIEEMLVKKGIKGTVSKVEFLEFDSSNFSHASGYYQFQFDATKENQKKICKEFDLGLEEDDEN